jgi:hypothetical protein
MRLKIEIDDTLMAEAQRISGHTTPKEVVEEALQLMIELRGPPKADAASEDEDDPAILPDAEGVDDVDDRSRRPASSKSPVGPVDYVDLSLALDFASSNGGGRNFAYICRETGKILFQSDFADPIDEIPDDIDDFDKYIPVPTKRDLDLGQRLVFAFVRQFLPNEYDNVRRIFSRKGAYARFGDLLRYRGATDRWHAFENAAEEKALLEWCEDNAIKLTRPSRP